MKVSIKIFLNLLRFFVYLFIENWKSYTREKGGDKNYTILFLLLFAHLQTQESSYILLNDMGGIRDMGPA